MDSATLLHAITDVAGPWKSVIIMGAFLWLLLWALGRMGSFHIFVMRLYTLFVGKQRDDNSPIGHFLDQRSDLMRFRLATGIEARTLNHAKQLIQWCEDHDEEISAISRSGKYFDCRNVKISEDEKIPAQWKQTTWLFGSIVSFYMAILWTVFLFGAGLFVVIKNEANSPHFVLSARQFWVPFRSSAVITLTDCAMGNTSVSEKVHITPVEAATACSWLKDAGLRMYLDDGLRTQRGVMSVPLMLLTWLFLYCTPRWVSAGAATAMRRRQVTRAERFQADLLQTGAE
jgi:hypothetical protein